MKFFRSIIFLSLIFLNHPALAIVDDFLLELPQPQWSNPKTIVRDCSSICISGNIRVKLQMLPPSNDFKTIITESPKNARWLKIKKIKNTLYLKEANDTPPLQITIKTNHLDQLALYGRSSIIGKHIRSTYFTLLADTTGNILLLGKIRLGKINSTGGGRIFFSPTNSSHIIIDAAGHTHIDISGTARLLEARLTASAYLNAQNLQVDTALVQTKDFAIAKVVANRLLGASAENASNIYFYRTPQYLTHDSVNSANVLQVTEY